MNTIEAIKSRRNIKEFKKEPLDLNKVKEWLEAASYAPNHRMTEPWKIKIVGPQTRAALRHKTDFGGAPVVLLLTSKGSDIEIERTENALAVACFAQNFMLAARSEGAGVFWSSLAGSPQSRAILGVPEEDDVIGIFGVGYPASLPPAKERIPVARKIEEMP
ncbi:nitroreductase family protein [Cohnella zeiphila]|uniref:Nitroreductase family protein n=1 Tax=Cohnella zeiphila TaxID=2761120 RepID=A0A7X0SMW6_9BACL|nr:nitroreductase family protein [Cohnella zeiphila]MBB6732932.1 nitroreductase family protein [Cohnella zeiphila]